jgi:signal transduction histidine kinase
MAPRPRILIIDDVPDNIDMLVHALDGMAEVRFALSGAQGLQRIREQIPDLVLLDVMMPAMNGYEVFAELQSDALTAGIPVIFVTAKSDALSETAAINAGAVDFINKPINPTVVKARVTMHLSHQAREREVRQLNAELEQRVLERTQALKDALRKVETAQQAKANLLANMSHEFRTPLNTVLGMSHLVAKRVPDPLVQEQMGMIAVSGKNLLSLLNDILNMSRLDANTFQIETMDFDLQTVVDACMGLVRARAQKKGLALEVQIEPAVPKDLHGDPLRLGQILVNFMGNAIKFSEQGSVILRIRLSDIRDPQMTLRFEVEDRGVGIRSEDQARIFDAFEQGDSSMSRAYGGVGIGLTISKFLAQLMGGRVGVISQLGRGSTFWADIPFACGSTRVMDAEGSDGNKLSQIARHLLALLAEDGLAAQVVWQAQQSRLSTLLGQRAEMFSHAVEGFDFPKAQHILQTAMQSHPQLRTATR